MACAGQLNKEPLKLRPQQLREAGLHSHKIESNKHSVALYYKADLQSIESDLATFCNNFLNSDPSSRSVNQLWEEFKEVVNKAVTNHVPHKVNRSRNRLP